MVEFRSAQVQARAGNIFTRAKENIDEMNNNMDEGEDEVSSFPKRDKSCRALSLSCYLASLTFVIIIIQSTLSWLKDLTTKDEFWQSTQKFLSMYDQYNKTLMELPSMKNSSLVG